MKVITKTTPEGKTTHCTARCYNSSKKRCTCLCHGLLHGKGEWYAKNNAPQAAMYLQLNKDTAGQYFAASELIDDRRGR